MGEETDTVKLVLGFSDGTIGEFLGRIVKEKKKKKVRATFHLPEDLVNEARDAVVHLSGPPLRLTMAAMAENAIRRELDRLKREHNDGEPWPPRDEDLTGGRSIH